MKNIHLLIAFFCLSINILTAQNYNTDKAKAINIINYQDLCESSYSYKLLLGKKDKLIACYRYENNVPVQLRKIRLKDNPFILDADQMVFYYDLKNERLKQIKLVDDIACLQEGRVLAKKGALWGFLDQDAKLVIPLEYKQLYPFEEGLAIGLKDDFWGVIDTNGKTVIPFKFNKLVRSSSTQIVAYRPNGRRIYYDNKGNRVPQEMSSMTFEDYLYYANEELGMNKVPKPMPKHLGIFKRKMSKLLIAKGYYSYQLDGKYGAIDSNGTVLLEAKFDLVRSLDMSPYYSMKYKVLPANIILGRTRALGREMWTIFNHKGEQLSDEKFEWVSMLSNNSLKIGKRKLSGQRLYYGILDVGGEKLTSFEYRDISPFRNANDNQNLGQEFYVVKLDTNTLSYALIDHHGNRLNDQIYTEVQYYGKWHRMKCDGKYGFVNSAGKVVIPFQYQGVGYFGEGLRLAHAQNEQGQWGCINNLGETIVPFEFTEISIKHRDNQVFARKNGVLGILDTLGNQVLPFQFKSLEIIGKHHFKARTMEDKYGVYDYKNKKYVIPPLYTYIKRENGPQNLSLLIVIKDEKFGLLDFDNNTIIEPQYRYLKPMRYAQGRFFEVNLLKDQHTIKGVFDLVNKKLLYPCEYRYLREFRINDKYYYRITKTLGEEYYMEYFDAVTGEFLKNETQPDGNFGLIQISETINGQKRSAWKLYDGPIISAYYKALHNFSNGYSLCQNEGKVGLLDKTGKEAIPMTDAYQSIRARDKSWEESLGGLYFAVALDGKWGIIDHEQNWTIPPTHNYSSDAWRAAYQKLHE